MRQRRSIDDPLEGLRAAEVEEEELPEVRGALMNPPMRQRSESEEGLGAERRLRTIVRASASDSCESSAPKVYGLSRTQRVSTPWLAARA